MSCIRGGVHTAQSQTLAQIYIGFCVKLSVFVSVSGSVNAPLDVTYISCSGNLIMSVWFDSHLEHCNVERNFIAIFSNERIPSHVSYLIHVISEAMGSKPGTSMKATQKDFLNWCLENGWDVDGSVDEKGA